MPKVTGFPVWVAGLCVFGALLASCLAVPGQSPPQITVTFRNTEDSAAVSTAGRSAIIEITSPSGIGGASVSIGQGPMPAQILVRLKLKGLEHLEFRYGDIVIVVELPTAGGEPFETVSRAGAAPAPIGPDSPYWMTARKNQGGSGQDTYIEVAVPQDFLSGDERSFSLQWIDFYR